MALPNGAVPHIFCENAGAAIEFYINAFGAKLVSKHPAPDGKRLMHAELEINGHAFYLCDDFPEYAGGQSRTPKAFGGVPMVLHMNVPSADEAYQKAIDAGATKIMEPADQFWGARYAQVRDPFGFEWAMMHPLKT